MEFSPSFLPKSGYFLSKKLKTVKFDTQLSRHFAQNILISTEIK